MSKDGVMLLVITAPFVIYVVARIVCAAYFRAKAHYLRRYFHESGQTKGRGH